MHSRSLSRELALLMLGQISDRAESAGRPTPEPDLSMETLLQQALASLSQHVREALDRSAADLQTAQQQLLDSELQDQGSEQLPRTCDPAGGIVSVCAGSARIGGAVRAVAAR